MPQSILHPNASILAAATVVGSKEHSGPLGAHFDYYGGDDRFGQNTWEKAESEMQRMAMAAAMDKAGLSPDHVDMLFAGDLLNQCVGSSYGLLSYDIPYFGLYGACSTSAEGLLLASAMIGGRQAKVAAAVTSSHNAAAERQFRSPLEYGGQRPPTGQWTVTGAGAFVVTSPEIAAGRELARVTHALPGIVVDLGITDANNMGAAMAPAAYDTLRAHFQDTGRTPGFYDLIVTGDLGSLGKEIVTDFFRRDGVDMTKVYQDCGCLLFDPKTQDVHAGGSGCGCSAVVLTGYLLRGMTHNKWKNILFCGTGALHSPTAVMQKESIPGICHAVAITTQKGGNP